MHFPQLPDSFGLDADFTYPKVLADDWRCAGTGALADIHFWFSARDDWFNPYGDFAGRISNIHVGIRSNVPDPDGGGPLYSMPGDTLWTRDFAPDSPHVTFNEYAIGDQGWFNPHTTEYTPNDHTKIYQCNIVRIPQPFEQQQDSIYWLELSIATDDSVSPDSLLGWKTADLARYPGNFAGSPFEDDAVWGSLPDPVWGELKHPDGYGLDLAFVVGGDGIVTGVKDGREGVPSFCKLRQNYPNPFNPTTTIRYELPNRERVTLVIYNVRGERVRVLVDGRKPAGRHDAVWNGRNDSGNTVASGVYFYPHVGGAIRSDPEIGISEVIGHSPVVFHNPLVEYLGELHPHSAKPSVSIRRRYYLVHIPHNVLTDKNMEATPQ